MMDEGPGASHNAFEADKGGTPERLLAEAAIERLRAEGGVFVEAVRATRMPMVVTDPSLPGNPIVFANEAFLALSGYGMAEVLGQGPYFMNGPETDPADAARFREALEEDRDEVVETVQYRKDGSRLVASLFLSAFKDADGRTLYRFLSYLDVTRRVAAEAEVVSRARIEAALRESEARLRQFGDASSDVLWIRDAETLQWEYLTPAFETIYGLSRERALAGDDLRNWAEFILPEDRDAALSNLERVRGGEQVDFEYRIRRASDGEVRWVRDSDFPMRDATGQLRRIGGIGRDVTERKREADRMGVLVAELQHRTRNLLAVVRNLARKSIERSPGLDEYDARLAALGRVQGLLSRSAAFTVPLHDLVDAELHAAGDGVSDRVTVEGPPVELPGAGVQTVALALHELATNAVKYGALGQPTGRLSVTWRVDGGEDGPSLLIAWRESGVVMPEGPPVRRGYGSELLTRALPYQLKAQTRLEFGPDGVWCDILLPLQASHALQVAP